MARGIAKLEVVGALNSYRSPGVEVSPISVSKWNPFLCSDLWFGAFWAPPKGVAVTPHYLSLDIPQS